MVELRGIEPRTSWMQIKRSPSWAIAPFGLVFFPIAALLRLRQSSHVLMYAHSFLNRAPCTRKKSTAPNPLFLWSAAALLEHDKVACLTLYFIQIGFLGRRRVHQHMSITKNSSWIKLVGLGGFEPPTSPLSGVRSNQLSYRPVNRYSRLLRRCAIYCL